MLGSIAIGFIYRYNINMVQNETFFESHDGTKLYLYKWLPDQSQYPQPKAALHIVHGMAEHALRYERLAEKLIQAGIEVWAADQRGHGKTADLKVNKADKGGLLGHTGDGSSAALVTADVHAINVEIRKSRPDTPLFLLGHSWGSFIAQNLMSYASLNVKMNEVSGYILSGTKGPGDFMIKAGIPIMTMIAAVKGQQKGSAFARALADGPYNKFFKPNRTPFDWLCRSEAEVDKYIEDPLCGFLCSTGFYRELAKLLYNIHRPDALKRINTALPVYVFCGSDDPVGDMGKSPTALVGIYKNLGISDCEFVLYPGARHEILNETNREEVIENLLSWIIKHC